MTKGYKILCDRQGFRWEVTYHLINHHHRDMDNITVTRSVKDCMSANLFRNVNPAVLVQFRFWREIKLELCSFGLKTTVAREVDPWYCSVYP